MLRPSVSIGRPTDFRKGLNRARNLVILKYLGEQAKEIKWTHSGSVPHYVPAGLGMLFYGTLTHAIGPYPGS